MTEATLTPDQIQQIRDRVDGLLPGVIADLKDLVRIPSVSAASFDQEQVARSADAVAALFRAEGMDVEVVREGGRPAVIGHIDGPPGAPTVTLYAHHDVQPPGEREDWDSEPFEPQERDGRLYGRGAADDKAGVMAHIAALRAHQGNLPVGLTIFVEGEEESGSPSLETILDKHGHRLAADAIVIADSGNWDIGTPALTTTLRGGVRAVVTVRTLDHSVHSGMFGGAVPDAVTALIRLLATLHDEHGSVAVSGLDEGSAAPLDYDEARLRAESGLLDGVSPIGTGTILDRIWTKPSITTIGMSVTSIEKSSNTLAPKASAKISMRIAPGQDPATAYEALRSHLLDHAPWGAQVSVELEEHGSGFSADADGPVYDEVRAAFTDAWGKAPVDMGVGGSIPFISSFVAKFPEAAILVTGVEDPDTRAHGANESLHLAEFRNVCVAEAVFLARMGALARS